MFLYRCFYAFYILRGQKMYRAFFADEMAVSIRHEYKKSAACLQIAR